MPLILEVEMMEVLFKVLLVISSIGLIVTVLLQSGKSAGLSGAISGGAEHLFGRTKARGLDLLLSRLTLGLAIAFFVLSLVVGYYVKS
jgi:preprotein translocase subunit SecG